MKISAYTITLTSIGLLTLSKKQIVEFKETHQPFEKNNTIGPVYGTMKDIDGNVYKTVKIGNQTWMAENLNVTSFKNGEAITQAPDKETWDFLWKGGEESMFANFNFEPVSKKAYGKFYNIFSVFDPRGLAPEGWRIPTEKDWIILMNYINAKKTTKSIKSLTGWRGGFENNGNGDNTTGFNAQPIGYLDSSWDNTFRFANFWSIKDNSTLQIVRIQAESHRPFDFLNPVWQKSDKQYPDFYSEAAVPIRCIKN
jgi:uncharacterized protein (TIGR02145 family)